VKYPNKCVRCGFCCLSETCPIGMDVYGIGKHETKCPALRFEKNKATCLLAVANLVPTGDGCCILARAIKDGVQYDFASLSKELKINVVQSVREIMEHTWVSNQIEGGDYNSLLYRTNNVR